MARRSGQEAPLAKGESAAGEATHAVAALKVRDRAGREAHHGPGNMLRKLGIILRSCEQLPSGISKKNQILRVSFKKSFAAQILRRRGSRQHKVAPFCVLSDREGDEFACDNASLLGVSLEISARYMQSIRE